MSAFGGWSSADEQQTFIRLERWLASICGKANLSFDEQLIGTGLIADHRRALGLPLLPQPGEKTRDFDREAELLGPGAGLHLVRK